MTGPPVWFERAIPPGLVQGTAQRCEVLGPGDATPDDPYSALAPAVAIMAGAFLYNADVMDRAPGLRVIARTGIGVDRVDLAAATERGIAVVNTPDGPTVSTAEHALTLLLMIAKNVRISSAQLRSGSTGLYGSHDAIELQEKILGLVGYGRIAQQLARYARSLGMVIRTFDPYTANTPGAEPTASLPDLLAAADVVSVHVPLTTDTVGMFGAAEFAEMKPDAIFVNTARGGLVDQEALLAAIDSGHLFGAGLDVTEPEPLPSDHPLLHRDNVVVTPHVASGTRAGKRRMFEMAFAQVVQVLDGERPPHLVNPEVWA